MRQELPAVRRIARNLDRSISVSGTLILTQIRQSRHIEQIHRTMFLLWNHRNSYSVGYTGNHGDAKAVLFVNDLAVHKVLLMT